MDLIGEDPGLDGGVAVHDLAGLVGCRVEESNAGPFALVDPGQHDREHSVRAEREVAPTVLPDDGVDVRPLYLGVFFSIATVYALVFASRSCINASVITGSRAPATWSRSVIPGAV